MIGASLLYGTVFGRIGVPNNKLAPILADVRLGRWADVSIIRRGSFQETGISDFQIRVGLKRLQLLLGSISLLSPRSTNPSRIETARAMAMRWMKWVPVIYKSESD